MGPFVANMRRIQTSEARQNMNRSVANNGENSRVRYSTTAATRHRNNVGPLHVLRNSAVVSACPRRKRRQAAAAAAKYVWEWPQCLTWNVCSKASSVRLPDKGVSVAFANGMCDRSTKNCISSPGLAKARATTANKGERTNLGHARGLELLSDGLDEGPGIVGVLRAVGVLDAPRKQERGTRAA